LKIKMIHQECDPSLSEDRSLPTNSYLVEYLQDTITRYDIVMANKQADIFDHYWDHYRADFKNMTQTEGRISPKLWGIQGKGGKKK